MHRHHLAAFTLSLLASPCAAYAQSSLTTLASSNVSSSSTVLEADSPALPPAPVAPVLHAAPRPHIETSFSLGVFPQLTATRTKQYGELLTESLRPSAGVLGTFRQQFTPWLGYSVNLGYSRTAEHVTYGPGYGSLGTPSNYYVAADLYETSLTWVGQKHITAKLTGFVDAGAGMMTFLPVHRGATAVQYAPSQYPAYVPNVTFHPEGVGGLGVDYHFTPSLALRAEYRAQVYKFADFGSGINRLNTVSSTPTVSLTYTFHHKKP